MRARVRRLLSLPLLLVTAWCACATSPIAAAGATDVPRVVVYDTAEGAAALLRGPGSLRGAEGVYQQGPARRLVPSARLLGKVAGGAGSAATPSLRGRTAPEMADLLESVARRSRSGLVFVDEVGGALGPAGAATLADALELLAARRIDGTPANLRVHLYVQHRPALLADPAGHAAEWRALRRGGGVWWQTYSSTRAWSPAEWATWPRLILGQVGDGGDPARLHWMLGRDATQSAEAQFTLARTGAACAVSAHGVGLYRMGGADTLAAYRSQLGAGISCLPAPTAPRLGSLGEVLALSAGGVLGEGQVRYPRASGLLPGQIMRRRPTRVVVDLGPDPLGIASRIDAPASDLLVAAGAQLHLTGPGVDLRLPAQPGPQAVVVRPSRDGRLEARLELAVAPLAAHVGAGHADLVALLDPLHEVTGVARLRAQLIRTPGRALLVIPLAAPDGGPIARVVAPTPARVARLVVVPDGVQGRWRRWRIMARDATGRPVAEAWLRGRTSAGHAWRRRTNAAGVVHIATPARGHTLIVWVDARSGVRATVTIPR